MKNNSEKNQVISSAVLSVFASKSLCVFCGYIYLSVMVPVLSKKPNRHKSKTKAFPRKNKITNLLLLFSCDGNFFKSMVLHPALLFCN